MKNKYIPYVVFVVLITILLFLGILKKEAISHNTTNYNQYNNKSEAKNSLPQNDEIFYLVKEKNSEIFLYDNNMHIVEKLNRNFDDLREYDKKIFISGIRFENINDVYSLIEDFSN